MAGSYPPAGILQAFDLTDPTEPVLVGEVPLESFGAAADIEAVGEPRACHGRYNALRSGRPHISPFPPKPPIRFALNSPNLKMQTALTFTLQPTITDTSGNPLNQDGDAVNGEPLEDQFVYPATWRSGEPFGPI